MISVATSNLHQMLHFRKFFEGFHNTYNYSFRSKLSSRRTTRDWERTILMMRTMRTRRMMRARRMMKTMWTMRSMKMLWTLRTEEI